MVSSFGFARLERRAVLHKCQYRTRFTIAFLYRAPRPRLPQVERLRVGGCRACTGPDYGRIHDHELVDGRVVAHRGPVEKDVTVGRVKRCRVRKRHREGDATVLGEEGHPPTSFFDFVQGIAAVARSEPRQHARFDLELRAKRLMNRVAV